MPQPLKWNSLKQTGTKQPGKRSGHTITTVNKTHILFGGLEGKTGKGERTGPTNDVFKITLAADKCQWTYVQCQGDVPQPRTNHAACAISDDKMLIFGGYYTSKSRFNDTYILKLGGTYQWIQPPNQKSVGSPKNAESKIGAPEPRADHSCTYYNGKVYVFGGHGGIGYSRQSFNDMYVLDTETFEWQLLEPSNTPPDPRGGHVASLLANQAKILIYGGWSYISQFSNLMIYDIEQNLWEDPELSHEQPKWNFSAILAPSIPSWKYFIFGGSVGSFEEGGNRTTSRYVDDTFYLDIDFLQWKNVDLEIDEQTKDIVKPKQRESPAIFYDKDNSRVVIYGGWSNAWLDDMWSLNVSTITGPAYAIFGIKPKLGPLTGKTKVTILGEGFKQSTNIIVKFFAGKQYQEVSAKYESDKELSAETPAFADPKKVQVVVSINKGDFTITQTDFQYYLNTDGAKCIAYGTGILQNNAINTPTSFIIQAINTSKQARESGADDFQVSITRPDLIRTGEEEDRPATQEQQSRAVTPAEQQPSSQQDQDAAAGEEKKEGEQPQEEPEEPKQPVDPSVVPFELIDNDDGTYQVIFQQPETCEAIIEVKFRNEHNELVPIRGSPFKVGFDESADPKNNQFTGPATHEYIKSDLQRIKSFIETAHEDIDYKKKNLDDVSEVITIMAMLNKIDEQAQSDILKLDTMEEMIKGLKKVEDKKEYDNFLKECKKNQDNWQTLIKYSKAVEKDIKNHKDSHEQRTKVNIQNQENTMKEYHASLKTKSFFKYDTGVEGSQQAIEEVKQQIQKYEEEIKALSHQANVFHFPQELEGCQKHLELIQTDCNIVQVLWEKINEAQKNFQEYLQMSWGKIDTNEMTEQIKKMRTGISKIRGVQQYRHTNTYAGIWEDLKKWGLFLPSLEELKDKAMQTEDERHWKRLKEQVGKEFTVDDNLQLQTVWDLELYNHKEAIEDICEKAKNEDKMDKGIQAIIKYWKDIVFELNQHKSTDVQTLKLNEDNFEQLEEHQLQINNMMNSKYIAFYEKTVEQWKQDLGAIYDVILLLKEIQNTWSFLENLFIQSEEVKKELPEESKQFVGIDKNMKEIMKNGAEIKLVKNFCTQEGLYPQMEQIQKELKVCEKALNDFLDSKRRAFPRFYFLSVEKLLDILSNGNQPKEVNKHMSQIFQAVKDFTMEDKGSDRPTITSLKSSIGIEEVQTKPLELRGKVEVYLQDCIVNVKETLNEIASKSIQSHSQMDRKEWLKQDPSQITLLINNIFWSGDVEECFEKGGMNAMRDFKDKSISQLTDLIKMVQGDLSKPLRQKIMCMITLDAHSRDVVIKLIDEGVRKPTEFQWQSQLKFSWENNNARIKICDAAFWYNYEYLGNGPRLVVTPLTDRIYVTATQALHLNMGCAPAGPAGTGKTETTKDLANALAKACYVFNCGPEMDYQTMGNIYKGLASSGCWGCFDEFNRLLPEVLSVCSVQFKAVTDGVKSRAAKIVVEGDEVTLDPTCGAFITMNPGYLGRAELPEGLKALFRPITVVVPDLELICENILMAEGFVGAKVLAKKFTTLYLLCKDLLSKQKHYDWGMRAIKSVLVVAGGFKRSEPEISEEALLMRALRDFNTPKIVFQDVQIFAGLLGDLFPGIEVLRKRDMQFEGIIESVCKESKLHPDPEFILKIVQLKELLEIRHCVFIMGPPGAGKSSTWQQLQKAYDKDGKKCNVVDLDPKVVSTKDFYGYIMPSKEWKDGLFSKLLRSMSELAEDENPKWIILDGDLDANWIESMNSVMDDNKILTLANNERIFVKGLMRLIFEIRDLRFATPATCSRAGILYISDQTGYQWKSYVESWIERTIQKEDDKKSLRGLFQRYIENTLNYLRKNSKYLIPMVEISQVISICKALEPMLELNVSNLEYIFVCASVWGIGGALAEKDGIDYKKDFSTWWKGGGPFQSQVRFPSNKTVFDYFVESSENQCRFVEWSERLHTIEFDPAQGQMSNITVPTIQTVATSDFIKKFIEIKHPSLLIGNAGSGKSQLAKGILKEIVKAKSDQFSALQINFNYYTDSNILQSNLEQQLEKKAGRQYGPQGKGVKIFFIDDLNMPMRDPYDTQSSIALLRQLQDYGHWYDITKLSLKDIINTQLISAMNPSAGSFFVNPRLQRHFWTISIPFPDQDSLNQIYSTFLNGHLKKFKAAVQEQANNIIKATVQIHAGITEKFKKTAINFHYEFNLRHISNIFQGLLLSNPGEFSEPEKLLKLWIHEVERTYGDRLVSAEHLKTMRDYLFNDVIKKCFGAKFNFQRYFQKDNPEPLVFIDFTKGIADPDRNYDALPKTEGELFKQVNEGLKEYNEQNAYMGLVLFDDALKHITRICRILKFPSGHALLVGIGGSGKQSLSKLSGFIMGMTLFQITISGTYGIGDLKTDLQSIFNKAGPKDEKILFLFTEGQITNERFLVYINDLLSSGEIADLYTLDEKEAMVNNIRNKVKAEGIPDTKENCWNFFVDQIKKNLHMSICFSPVGDMRRRARQFPALINSTVIDWFQPWPEEALYNVGKEFLSEVELGTDEIREGIQQFMPHSFKLVNELCEKFKKEERRYAYTTPKSFLELIKLFQNMLEQKRHALTESIEKYETGLVKLKETEEQVAIIEVDVREKQVSAEIVRKEADEFAAKVGVERAKVDKENAVANVEKEKCNVIKTDVTEKQRSTQEDLDAAAPLVEQALASLDSITKKDFQTAKSFSTPPAGVDSVFSATCWLLAGFYPEAIDIDKNKKPKAFDWKSCIKLMQKTDVFVSVLQNFKTIVDQNLVPAANVKYVKDNYLSLDFFEPETMKRKSNAAAGLCSWVINIVKYFDVIQTIEPKRKALEQANEQLKTATAKLIEVEAKVSELQEQLDGLNAQYNEAVAKKQAAEAEADRCTRRLDLAQRLVSALGSEKTRWGASIVNLNNEIQFIVGDVLLAASFVSYAGPFNKKFRTEMIQNHFQKFLTEKQIPMTPGKDPVTMLTPDSVAAQWNQQSLPSDSVSIANGTILTNSERYPLMIDPQLQGVVWIKEKEKENKLRLLRLGQKNTNKELENCIQNGYSAMFENMDETIDAIIMPVVARQVIKRGKNVILKFAGNDLTLHPNFRLFLHTKLSNPHYPPEVQAEAAIINFMVTEDGLCDQLLTQVVGRERPDLAKSKVELINQQNNFKIELQSLEKQLLYKLANAQGDILDDIALIENLEYSKKLSDEIKVKVEIAKETEAKINETSENYRPAASRGALFYFLLSDLPKIHSFYKYSLESFVTVINRAIDNISENKMYQGVQMDKFTGQEDDIPDDQPEEEEEEENEEEQAVEEEQQQEEVKPEEQQQAEDKPEGEEADKPEGEEGEQQQQQEGEEGEQQQQQEGEEGEKPEGEEPDGEQQEEGEGEGEGEGEEKPQEANDADEPLSPRSLKKRVSELIDSLTYTAYQSTRRGLFEKHKLIVATLLTLRVQARSGILTEEEINHLIIGKVDPNPGSLPEVLKSFISKANWSACKALESLPQFNQLSTHLETEYLQWKKWYSEEKAEISDLPKIYKDIDPFHKLLLLRALRPDRLTSALGYYVQDVMGQQYVEQPAFNMEEIFTETLNTVPIFFVLFPGVDPTPEVERVAAQYDISIKNGRFTNISMGQGQEEGAKKAVFESARKGYWVMLQNVHLMQSWLTGMQGLEGFLEQVFQNPKTHKNFRVFISSEPPPLPDMPIIPESILQGCLKIANEAPSYLKANLRRAYALFDQDFLDQCDRKPNEFKACLFGLCMFHSLIIGRKKFGSQGWSRVYNFNDGDLKICADVLMNYLQNFEQVPYEDLKYLFGEIMYGGHITDNWDRRTNRTYLETLIKQELLQPNFNLTQGYKSPAPEKYNYEKYKHYIEDGLPVETPQMFGMHPNAEIGYLTQQCDQLFSTIQEVSGGSGGGSKDGADDEVKKALLTLQERTPPMFNMIILQERAAAQTPFQVVCLQECERMNGLILTIKVSLEDLRLGLEGALNMTDQMELLGQCIQFNKLPGNWEEAAYFSKKPLQMWFDDMLQRVEQLERWSSNMETPNSLCISYLFNPMSFLTAISQNTARQKGYALDNIDLQTDVTAIKTVEEVTGPAADGAYIHGLYLEGAAWEAGGEGQEGYLIDQKPKELHPKMPIINVISLPREEKKTEGQYNCPLYVTSARGATYVTTANLNMEDESPNKWILSGTCLLMSDD